MEPSAQPASSPLSLRTEYDVVVVRHAVRQAAREVGLGLSQQAKISTAISTIARALLAAAFTTMISIQTESQNVLAISCTLAGRPIPDDLGGLEAILNISAARSLVDEASLQRCEDGTLRLQIRAATQG